jgi:hypothetical protein
MKDLYSNVAVSKVIDPVVGANSSAPAAVEVDLAGYNSAVFCVYVGTNGSSLSGSNYWTWKMEHADDNGSGAAGDYANVSASDVQGVTPASGIVLTVDADAEDNTLYKIGYIGGKRFVKITTAETGSAPDLPQCVFVIKGHPLDAPVA